MTQFLPPNLLALFAARDPIPYLPPVDKLPYEKKNTGYSGIATFVKEFEDPRNAPPPLKIETREERQERKRIEKAERVAYKLEQDIALWDPHGNTQGTGDPYKTLFVARVNYDTSESKLRREFEVYGPIKKIIIVHNKASTKPRGYAFIEYEHERDMKSAYKHADGKKIDGRRVLVDVERGRTVKGWLPRRLGGGLGGTRRGGPDINLKHSGREEPRPDDRYMDRDRERPERIDRRRSRSRSRERRRRSRSRERHRPDRHKRDRSRDRDRMRERDLGPTVDKVDGMDAGMDIPEVDTRKERRRSRSRDRDRDRKRRRSRSRDRKRRDYDRERESRRERGTERVTDRDERRGEEPSRRGEEPSRRGEEPSRRGEEPLRRGEEPSFPEDNQDDYNTPGYDNNYNNYNTNNNVENDNYEGY